MHYYCDYRFKDIPDQPKYTYDYNPCFLFSEPQNVDGCKGVHVSILHRLYNEYCVTHFYRSANC